MSKAQASAELVVVVSALMLIFLLIFMIKSSYDDSTKDYIERLEAERIAKQYTDLVNYVALGGHGTEVAVVNTEGPYYTITFNGTITVNSSRAVSVQAPITRRMPVDASITGAGRVRIYNQNGEVYVVVS
jgi:uncharacterized protein (UPF0333 family)